MARASFRYAWAAASPLSGAVIYERGTFYSGDSVGSNSRFRWTYRPGSEQFVVYTDDDNSDPRPGIAPLRNRAVVVTINRLFRPEGR